MKTLDVLRKNLRNARLGTGITQQALAELTSLDYKYYQDLEAGRVSGVTIATIEKLSEALHVEVWKLFHLDVIPESKVKRAKSEKIDR